MKLPGSESTLVLSRAASRESRRGFSRFAQSAQMRATMVSGAVLRAALWTLARASKRSERRSS